MSAPLCAKIAGFSLHASRVVDEWDRDGLERLCRYGLRAPFSKERLSLGEDGRVTYHLRRPWPNAAGATCLVLEPTDLLRRQAALVPAPYANLVRYHGIFAGRSHSRARLPRPPAKEADDHGALSRSPSPSRRTRPIDPAPQACPYQRRHEPRCGTPTPADARRCPGPSFSDVSSSSTPCRVLGAPLRWSSSRFFPSPRSCARSSCTSGSRPTHRRWALPFTGMSSSRASVKMPWARRQPVRHPETAGVLGRRRRSPLPRGAVTNLQPAPLPGSWPRGAD